MNRRQRLVLVGVLGVLGSVVGGAVALGGLREPGGRLPYARRDIPPEQNGWPVLMAACELYVKAPEGISRYPVAEPPPEDVLAHLAANQAFCAMVDEALTWPDLETPDDTEEGMWAAWPWLVKLRDYARLKAQRAVVYAHEQRPSEALSSVTAPIVLGRRLTAASGGMINYVVGIAIEAISYRHLEAALAALDPTPEVVSAMERLATLLVAEPDAAASLHRSILVEAAYCDRHLELVPDEVRYYHPGSPRHLLYRLPNPWYSAQRVRAQIRPYFRALAQQALRPRAERDLSIYVGGRTGGSSWRLMSLADDVADLFAATPSRLFDKHDQGIVLRRAAATVLALYRFRAAQGRIPPTLDELVAAGLLPAVPVDPFDGQPLRYDPERRILWSISADEHDDGGDEHKPAPEDWPRDLVVHLTFANDKP